METNEKKSVYEDHVTLTQEGARPSASQGQKIYITATCALSNLKTVVGRPDLWNLHFPAQTIVKEGQFRRMSITLKKAVS